MTSKRDMDPPPTFARFFHSSALESFHGNFNVKTSILPIDHEISLLYMLLVVGNFKMCNELTFNWASIWHQKKYLLIMLS